MTRLYQYFLLHLPFSFGRKNIGFLRTVNESQWLHERPTILEAIRRYEELWMPLMSDLTVGAPPPMILPPVDIEWVWFCHSLNPVRYRQYCESRFSKLIEKPAIFDEENEEYALMRCREIWEHKYPSEPFENEVDSDSENPICVTNEDILDEKFSDGCSLFVPASDIQLIGGGGREPVKIVLIKTQYIETDARSFKSVVQELTGKDSGARGSNLSHASKSRKVRSNLGTKIMEGGMNINGFAEQISSHRTSFLGER
ncbi:hypothetical protein WN944_018705 [Citrus x changshan-huyou]|uniref:VQ domain-containing protein n=1 Tax=Citrus x changshan-huyou TaxID=2935761 RepID=A0AAP0LTX2_9ROSI